MAEAATGTASEALLFRGVAHGDRRAVEELLDKHGDWVYGLLRMALPGSDQAEEALGETFAAAAERASGEATRRPTKEWLLTIAVERIRARADAAPVSLEQRRRQRESGRPRGGESVARTRPPVSALALAGVNDRALGVIVRTLQPRVRQALVLRVICELETPQVARAIGCSHGDIDRLVGEALDTVRERIGEHEERDELLRQQLSEANPYKLRKIDGMTPIGRGRPNFSTVIQGDRVYIDKPPTLNPLELLKRAVTAIVELFRRHQDDYNFDDDVGDSDAPKSPERTPGDKPFDRPKRTPSLTDYRTPKLSPGVAVYAMPRSTPGTERISNPRQQSRPGWNTSVMRGGQSTRGTRR